MRSSIEALRCSLRAEIDKWRNVQVAYMPTLSASDEPELAENPEDQDLGLPSDFNQGDRERLCLNSFAQIEKSLLEGLAHDALAAVREHIKHKKAYLQLKDEVIRNQGANTRAQAILKRAQNLTLTHANRYNFIRERLLLLGLSPNDSTFRPLSTKDDLWMYSFNTSRTRRSEGSEPWYWTMQPVGNATDKEMQEWMLEGSFYVLIDLHVAHVDSQWIVSDGFVSEPCVIVTMRKSTF